MTLRNVFSMLTILYQTIKLYLISQKLRRTTRIFKQSNNKFPIKDRRLNIVVTQTYTKKNLIVTYTQNLTILNPFGTCYLKRVNMG